MVGAVAGLLTSPIVKIVSDKLSSAIAEQTGLVWNFEKDLEEMKDTMESMAAVLKDAEKQSVTKESALLWLKRLKHAALDISNMMDLYHHHTDAQPTTKMSGGLSYLKAVPNMMVLANKMKKMRWKLERINKERWDFHFADSTTTSPDQQRSDEHETTSAVTEAKILGRDGPKKDIIDILSASHNKDGTMFLPIYGLGGLGKSTLAQLVYNDTQFKQYQHRLWVYVSEVFDLKKIGRSIILHLSKDEGQQNFNILEMIEQRLNELLPQKRILIVLDDIWENDALKLNKLKQMLHVDKAGSMVDVIVTTRSESIANKICSNNSYKLQPLDDSLCWDIIKRSSGFEGKSNKGELEQIGLKIAKKCGGVALAAQALGYMLSSKKVHGWREVENSEIWNESFGADDPQHMKVLQSLMLSYERMPPILRLLFSYCTIFPKGYDIYEDDLVHQWIALDFIKKPWEGKEYIKQLLGMSFLEPSKLPVVSRLLHMTRYTMHDLVHDLAKSAIGDELILIDASTNKNKNTSEHKYCHFALFTNYDGQKKLSNILPEKVRALHFTSSSKLGPRDGSLSFARCLRILDFRECSEIVLPPFIGQLNQLRCLIAPNLKNERLPESSSELSKLHYLNLRGSSRMSALPESISKLSDLMHLCLYGCSSIPKVPESLGELKYLMHLDMSHCSRITVLPESLGELKCLMHLDMSHCSKITVLPELLGELKCLMHLDMSHCSEITALPESLGGLERLVHLDISNCSRITTLPESLGELKSLVYLVMHYCSGITTLPGSLVGLESLVYLDMTYCFEITALPELFGGLKSLVHLFMSHCFEITALPESFGELKSLVYLDISYCSKITALPESFGGLKSLVHLDTGGCSRITALPQSLDGLQSLENLNMNGCNGITVLPESLDGLKNLVKLDMSRSGITVLPNSLGYLKNLRHLDLFGCSGFKELPETFGGLSQLQYLNLSYCRSITSLQESIGKLINLKYLSLSDCKSITSLPESIASLINLQHLSLSGCTNLESLPDRISEITTLKFVDIEWCSDELKDQASSKLHGLLTLPDFKVRADDIRAGSNLTLLKDVNIGELRISSLENVRFLEEASIVKLFDKSNLSGLTLAWTLHSNRLLNDKVVLEELVPPRGLENLNLEGYSSRSFPSWLMNISCHLPNLTRIALVGLHTCSELMSPLGQLPQLTELSLIYCCNVTKIDKDLLGGNGAFPQLSKLHLDDMEGLEEWSTTYYVEDGDVEMCMFPKLSYLEIINCPKLRLKSCLPPTLKYCHIEASDQVVSSLEEEEEVGNSTGLEFLSICGSGSDSNGLRVFHHFPKVQRLDIVECAYLTRLPESMRHLTSLTSLTLNQCDGISALPEWIGDLSSLNDLWIGSNPELKRWCELEENKKKLAHIEIIDFEDWD